MPGQIKKWKKKNPDDVDEMPVEANDFDRHVVAVREVITRRQDG
jgi:hypothetical protein